MATSRTRSLTLCENRRIGHTWNDPDNQHWEPAESIKIGRRWQRRVRCIGRCTRCGSERIEPFFVDTLNHLAERDTIWYRHSDEYKNRDRLAAEERDWQRIPASVLRQLAS